MTQSIENDEFSKAFLELNDEQRLAVESIHGPLMVIAGPGTGKTQVLTLRIANILKKEDVSPENILALTFTESGASTMRKRLIQYIGLAAYSINIKTFHGFANDIIQTYPEYFPNILGRINLVDVDASLILEKIIQELSLKELRPYAEPFYYLKAIESAIREIKHEGIDVKEFLKIVELESQNFNSREDLFHTKGAYKGKMKGVFIEEEKLIKKHKELASIYEAYEVELMKARFYDYADMIKVLETTLRENDDLRLILEEKYQFILIDEHQDTNNSQNKIIESLVFSSESPNLFVVGDEKQAIFRFQGASIENFLYFKSRFKDVKIITLKSNYRSTNVILNAAQVIKPSQIKLEARASKPNELIKIVEVPTMFDEAHYVLSDIKNKIQNGISPSSMAVIAREHRDFIDLIKYANYYGLEYNVRSHDNLFSNDLVREIILIMEAVIYYADFEITVRALHVPIFQIQPFDLYKVIAYCRKRGLHLFDCLRKPEILHNLDLSSMSALYSAYEVLTKIHLEAKNKVGSQVFDNLLHYTGLMNAALNSSSMEKNLALIGTLFDEYRELLVTHNEATLADFLIYLKQKISKRILPKIRELNVKKSEIRFLTVHQAKGQEFDYVYIIETTSQKWGKRRKHNVIALPLKVFSRSTREIMALDEEVEERNIFYVALTRAKNGITIIYPKINNLDREVIR